LDGLSKSAALPQLKLAWTAIAGPAAWRDAATARLEHIADSFLSPSTPVQRALASLLGEAPPLQARIRARCATNLTVLRRALGNESAASVLAVEGGWYAIVRLPGVLDEERWALDLLERDALIVQPGYFYDLSAGAHIVLSLITPEADFAEGARRIAARVARAIA
jgi:aspartate/methionine/tyrosine aminotransferase